VAARFLVPRLTDIIEAIEHIRTEMTDVTLDAFECDWRKRWIVERGVEIISEASRQQLCLPLKVSKSLSCIVKVPSELPASSTNSTS
jgi:hypothetical protein